MTAIVDICCDFRYEAAHWLPMVPDDHQCHRMHGHSYRLAVVISGPVGDDGFVVDFADVKSVVAPLVKHLDHQCLNDFLSNPTVENQLVWFWDQIVTSLPRLAELRIYETANNSAAYRGEQI